MVQSNGNNENPEMSATFEHLDDQTQQVQDQWVRLDKDGTRQVAFTDKLREELGIKEEEEDESKSD